jgi:hypothetical protein
MRPLHSGSLYKYYAPSKLLKTPKRALVVFLRLCTVGGMLALIAAPLTPGWYVIAQALLALLENVLSRAEPKPLEEPEEPEEPDDHFDEFSMSKRQKSRFSSFSTNISSPRTSRASRALPEGSTSSTSTSTGYRQKLFSRTSSFSGIVVERRKARCSRFSGRSSPIKTIKTAAIVARMSPLKAKAPPPTPSAPTGPSEAKQKSLWPKPQDVEPDA